MIYEKAISFFLVVAMLSLTSCGEAPYVLYRYSGTVTDASGNPVEAVKVKATENGEPDNVFVENRDENVTSTTSDSNGSYTIQIGFRGDWEGDLVFEKAGYATVTRDISSDQEQHKENDIVAEVVNVVMAP